LEIKNNLYIFITRNTLKKYVDDGTSIKTHGGFLRPEQPKSCSAVGYARIDRKNLNPILERTLSGESITVVCTHRDQLARFGFELIIKILQSSGGKLVVLNQLETPPINEFTAVVLTIIASFSSRIHGLRSHKNKKILLETIGGTENSPEEMAGSIQVDL
jgi:hypothetical protein